MKNIAHICVVCEGSKYQEVVAVVTVGAVGQQGDFAVIVPGILATYSGRAINLMSPQAQL